MIYGSLDIVEVRRMLRNPQEVLREYATATTTATATATTTTGDTSHASMLEVFRLRARKETSRLTLVAEPPKNAASVASSLSPEQQRMVVSYIHVLASQKSLQEERRQHLKPLCDARTKMSMDPGDSQPSRTFSSLRGATSLEAPISWSGMTMIQRRCTLFTWFMVRSVPEEGTLQIIADMAVGRCRCCFHPKWRHEQV